MREKQKTNEKTCTFYTSDYHFEMISLPYIIKNLEQNKEVIILTENNLEETIYKVISRMNLSEDKKTNILKIDWKENDLKKVNQLKEISKKEKKAVVFIKGKENYIKNINENIKKYIDEKKEIKIIDCYDFEEISTNLNDKIREYKRVLTTAGEKEVEKI